MNFKEEYSKQAHDASNFDESRPHCDLSTCIATPNFELVPIVKAAMPCHATLLPYVQRREESAQESPTNAIAKNHKSPPRAVCTRHHSMIP
jgi:hypothetical protein